MQTHTINFCPHCGTKRDGHFPKCPECGYVFDLERVPQNATILPRITPPVRKRDPLCFFLGFFLPLLGIVIAAIIGKRDGVEDAVNGWFAAFFVVLLLVVIIGLASLF